MNFTETAATLPATDIVSVLVDGDWIEVCRHVHQYLGAMCEAWGAQDCRALSVGPTPCFKGICICATPTTRRAAVQSTELVAAVQHYGRLANGTSCPPWMLNWTVLDTDPDETYWLLGLSCLFALMGLCVAACVVRTCRRYLGYKKLEAK